MHPLKQGHWLCNTHLKTYLHTEGNLQEVRAAQSSNVTPCPITMNEGTAQPCGEVTGVLWVSTMFLTYISDTVSSRSIFLDNTSVWSPRCLSLWLREIIISGWKYPKIRLCNFENNGSTISCLPRWKCFACRVFMGVVTSASFFSRNIG